MPNVSRPDLLPFALPDTIGLPFHGLVKNGNAQASPAIAGTLYLPSDATRTYTQPYDGGTIMVQHPRHAALVRNETEQAYDTAHDHQWLEYALLSGRLHQIGGQDLGQHYHLYCDANYTWKIRTALSSGTGSCTIRIYLNGLFGMFSDASYVMTERLLATYTWSPQTTAGTPLGGLVGNRYLATYSKTGAKMMLNVGTTAITSGVGPTIYTQHNTAFQMHDVIGVTISGNGSLVAGSIGSGISASIAHIAWGNEFFDRASGGSGTELDPSWSSQVDRYHYVTDPNGNETHIEITTYKESYTIENRTQVGEDERGPIYRTWYAVESNATQTATFAGQTFANVFSYSGRFNHPDTDCGTPDEFYLQEGTATANGTIIPVCEYDGTVPSACFKYIADLEIDTVLPLLVHIYIQYKNSYICTATGAQEVTALDAYRYFTFNPATNAWYENGANRICYV